MSTENNPVQVLESDSKKRLEHLSLVASKVLQLLRDEDITIGEAGAVFDEAVQNIGTATRLRKLSDL